MSATPASAVRTLTYHEVSEQPLGNLKLWLHYSLLYNLLKLLPLSWRWSIVKKSRRWLYGPNANNEDLNALLQRLRAKL